MLSWNKNLSRGKLCWVTKKQKQIWQDYFCPCIHLCLKTCLPGPFRYMSQLFSIFLLILIWLWSARGKPKELWLIQNNVKELLQLTSILLTCIFEKRAINMTSLVLVLSIPITLALYYQAWPISWNKLPEKIHHLYMGTMASNIRRHWYLTKLMSMRGRLF